MKPEILKTCPSERTKFVSIGGTVLTTAAMATVSATFALTMAISLPLPLAIAGGTAWGIAIMNLDRYLVASTTRQEHFLQNLAVVVPRLLLAVLLGFVIAEPLVLRIFAAEISAESDVILQQRSAQFEANLATDPRFSTLDDDKTRVAELEAITSGKSTLLVDSDDAVKTAQGRADAKEEQFNAAVAAVQGEAEGISGSGVPGRGPAYADKVATRDRLERELALLRGEMKATKDAASVRLQAAETALRTSAQEELTALKAKIAAAETALSETRSSFKTKSTENDGILARMEALDHLGERTGLLGLARWLLTACLIALDSLPVLVKLFMAVGKPSLYDRMLELHEENDVSSIERRLDGWRGAHEVEVKGFREQAELKQKLEQEASAQIAATAVRMQAELAEEALQQWKERERARMLSSLEDFIESADATPAPSYSSSSTIVPQN